MSKERSNMNKTKKLMLAIFSLIAIVSCGEADKSGDSGSGTLATTPYYPKFRKYKLFNTNTWYSRFFKI